MDGKTGGFGMNIDELAEKLAAEGWDVIFARRPRLDMHQEPQGVKLETGAEPPPRKKRRAKGEPLAISLINEAIYCLEVGDTINAIEALKDTKKAVEAPVLYSAEEAAKKLGRSTQTLAGWRSKGIGPGWHKDRCRLVFYRGEDLNAWIEEWQDGRKRKKAGYSMVHGSRLF